ncbi:OLC1v1038368C1 [Oldenlandia corymbosa var. corymbosa]|uniref:OLC1v1038368C1 n=1 Tax=Oldenlandia corymbosa var. corymbosa TaxID=529605 RepID=A0AAV1CZR1_OLDCO|nr:OLC1v1038368C1 [Oldenlandia corymbosa var. corymbosa]
MPVMEKLKMFVVQEPVVAASCLIAGVGLFLPAVVRPILDSFETPKQAPPAVLSDVVAGMTAKDELGNSGL